MNERPAIPADLRRRVLVEAGHRCAIHTCRHTDVDIHHIVPWEKCREHAYENLVALCPNCHRRADACEIDRKSLRMYKARLTAAIVPSMNVDVAATATDQWTISRIVEDRSEPPPFGVELEIPSFLPEDLQALNDWERAWATRELNGFRRGVLDGRNLTNEELWRGGFCDSLQGSFEVALFRNDIVSVRYSLSRYHAGAAHPHPTVRTITAQRKPLIVLELDDLFVPESSIAIRLSQIAVSQLLKSDAVDPDWVRTGAGPDVANFRHFNVVASGLLLTFPEYQVGSYAEGQYSTTASWADLRDLLNPRCAALAALENLSS